MSGRWRAWVSRRALVLAAVIVGGQVALTALDFGPGSAGGRCR